MADSNGRTALHLAAGKGHIQAMDFLLKAGADVNAEDEFGRTPMLQAIRCGQAEAVQTLIQFKVM